MELTLEEIRKKRGYTQNRLAEILQVKQSGLSKFERRPDMYVSMLRSFIQAMGGHLELRAVFSDESIEIAGVEEDGTLADIEELVNHHCRLTPIPPDCQYNEFRVKSVDENLVTFQKLSNMQYLEVPTRRILEILPGTNGELPVVKLRGSLNWSGQKRLWQLTD